MSKPSLRQSLLVRSVKRLLDDGDDVHAVVIMFTRHRWFLPYAIVAGLAVGMVAALSGVEGMLNWLVIAAVGGAVAGMATTNYWALADTSNGLVLCRSSRVRQYAKKLIRFFPVDTSITMVGSTVVSSDWQIDGVIYSMTKRWEATMRELAGPPQGSA